MWMLGATSTDAEGAASIDRLKAAVTSRGGQFHHGEMWGRRTLAYPIKGNREAAYYVARFSVESNHTPEIEHAVYADQSVIRHILVKAEEVEENPQQKTEQREPNENPAPAAAAR
jgi:small subunit ribosomal protein S6